LSYSDLDFLISAAVGNFVAAESPEMNNPYFNEVPLEAHRIVVGKEVRNTIY
jgi:hypothetical protein